MHRLIEKKIPISIDKQTLIDALHESSSLSKTALKSALEKGCVWLQQGKKTQRIRRAKKPLKVGDTVYLYYNEKILSSIAPTPELLLDKQAYSIWFKPAGVFSQGSKWGDHCALTRLVEKQLHRDTYLVHRLDRATSGLMLIAHNKPMASALSDLFAQRKIHKTYLAIVLGEFDSERTIDTPIDNKPAISHVQRINYDGERSLLSIKIETGRKHQIRKHLSENGFPIVGDRLYGHANKSDPENLALQAISLEFICPLTQQPVHIALEASKQLTLS